MSTEKALDPFALPSFSQIDSSWRGASLKRKFDSFLPKGRSGIADYPSPPMSNPPSPPRQPPESSRPDTFSSATDIPMTSSATAPFTSAFRFPPPQASTYGPPSHPYQPGFYSHPVSYPQPQSFFSGSQGGLVPSAPLGAQQAPGTTGPSVARPGRKSKAHVASACVNCKRAHLSCDVQRPCSRCVATGKEATCYDVQHKKRGRPRLREEGEFKAEQMVREPTAGPSTQPLADPLTRPIAGTKHRRTESLRSLRSQASEGSSGSSIPTPMFAPPGSMLPPPPMMMAPPSRDLPPFEIPTAYLDFDLRVIKANAPFQSILTGRDMTGQHLSDIAAPADEETFHAIRERLRAERERVEPTYMAPIIDPGIDPLQQISEADLERLAQPFSDRTYSWTRNAPGAPTETFPARIRLAKSGIYFVAVTLPSFRPAPPPQGQHSPAAMRSDTPQRRRGPEYQPPSMMAPYPAAPHALLPAPERPTFGQPSPTASYGPPQLASPFAPYASLPASQQLPPPPTTGQRSAAEPPTETTPYVPRSLAQGQDQPLQSPVHLAPMLGSTGTPAGPSARPEEGRTQETTASDDDEEGDERSLKKRRVVGIGDILQ